MDFRLRKTRTDPVNRQNQRMEWLSSGKIFFRDHNQPVSCFFGKKPASFAPSGLFWRLSLPGIRFAHPWLFSDRLNFGACVGMSFATETSERARFG